jgi:hypothetical protein
MHPLDSNYDTVQFDLGSLQGDDGTGSAWTGQSNMIGNPEQVIDGNAELGGGDVFNVSGDILGLDDIPALEDESDDEIDDDITDPSEFEPVDFDDIAEGKLDVLGLDEPIVWASDVPSEWDAIVGTDVFGWNPFKAVSHAVSSVGKAAGSVVKAVEKKAYPLAHKIIHSPIVQLGVAGAAIVFPPVGVPAAAALATAVQVDNALHSKVASKIAAAKAVIENTAKLARVAGPHQKDAQVALAAIAMAANARKGKTAKPPVRKLSASNRAKLDAAARARAAAAARAHAAAGYHAPATRNLSSGAKGHDVFAIQAVVKAKQTSTYDPQTIAAVRKWQTAHGRRATGIVDADTWKAMGFTPHYPGMSAETSRKMAAAQAAAQNRAAADRAKKAAQAQARNVAKQDALRRAREIKSRADAARAKAAAVARSKAAADAAARVQALQQRMPTPVTPPPVQVVMPTPTPIQVPTPVTPSGPPTPNLPPVAFGARRIANIIGARRVTHDISPQGYIATYVSE